MNNYFSLCTLEQSDRQFINKWITEPITGGIAFINEVGISIIEDYKGHYPSLLSDACVLWMDEESNFAGVYIDGILKGKVFFLSHNDLILVPTYRNIKCFYDAVMLGRLGDLYTPQPAFMISSQSIYDYPSTLRDNAQIKADEEIVLHLLKSIENLKEQNDQIKVITHLIPSEILQLLDVFLKQGKYIDLILSIYVFYGYAENRDLLLQLGKDYKTSRKLIKKLGIIPNRFFGFDKW